MTVKTMQTADVKDLLEKVAGFNQGYGKIVGAAGVQVEAP